jgi:hypothetical protein
MKNKSYTKIDKNIDNYLNTNNLRPGPPARLVNRILDGMHDTEVASQKINYFSFTFPITRFLPWTELTGIKISEDYGSNTSFFLEFLNNKQLILKAYNDIPLYYFGNLMCNVYSITTPEYRLIEYSDDEFNSMISNLERCSIGNKKIHNKIIYEVKSKPFVIVYNYYPSLTLFDFGKNRSKILLNEKNFKSRELMIKIGEILTLDIFLNNNNRLPFVWLNNGNPNNILFKINLDMLPPNCDFKNSNYIDIYINDIFTIDTLPYILDPLDKVLLKNLGEYLNSLNEFFKLLCFEFKSIVINGKDLDTFTFHCFDKLISLFKNSTGYTLSTINLFHISMGMLIMINNIIKIDLDPIETLINYIQTESIGRDYADDYVTSANSIKLDYFKYLLDFFKQIKDDNDQIFDWIDNTTFGLYEINEDGKTIVDKIIENQKKLKVVKSDLNELNKSKVQSEMNKVIEFNEQKVPEDFFNYNKNDMKKFGNDVHNGVYDVFDIDNDLVLEYKDRVYNKIEDQPPEPIIEPKEEVELPPQVKKLEVENLDNRDPHTVLTMEQLTNKIKKKELYDTLQMKKNLNPNEGEYLENKINEVNSNFEEEVEKEQK